MLFNDKAHHLELYNAINKTSYTNLDDLIISTLNRDISQDKNDLSFIINFVFS